MQAKAPETPNGNGPRWLGVPVSQWATLFQTVGFPTLLICFLLYAAWCYVPPVVEGHIQLLNKTGETLSKMDLTLQQSNVILQEIVDVERETKKFFHQVESDHNEQKAVLNEIRNAVKGQ